jgi:dethiobiotin synthetase
VRFVVVTGTSTGVGKTVVTAALAVLDPGTLVVKPVQTGAADGDSDAREVHRLSGAPVQEWTVLDEPLAPETAARRQGVEIPTVASYVDRLVSLDAATVIVEGAGGLLVRLDSEGGTLLDLASDLADAGHDVEVVVVAAAGLGTLNHTELVAGLARTGGALQPRGPAPGHRPARAGRTSRGCRQPLP